MTGKPLRHFTVVQSKSEVMSRLDRARDDVSMATLDLAEEQKDGDVTSSTFSVRQAEHSPDGSHLYVGVTDLDVTINIRIDTDGSVTAQLY